MDDKQAPLRIINSAAPIRICDNGGWTDTWFAKHGKIFNIAIYPYAQVQIHVFKQERKQPRITIHAENYGHRYTINKPHGTYNRNPLLEAAIEYMHIPDHLELKVSIFSEAPAGCSTGTSAAVSVALIGALDLLTAGRLSAHEVALAAHAIETKLLKQQCGIQDQLASAYGGINFIDMYDYPHASVSPIHISNSIWWELENRLSLIFLGHAHSSSEVHKLVIAELQDAGPEAKKLQSLRQTAEKSRNALFAGDFPALASAMIENTLAQAALNAGLVSPAHQKIIDIAKAHGAIGYKVNGAGGDGGSVTLLSSADSSQKRAMIAAIEAAEPQFQSIPIYLSRFGLRVWESPVV